MVTNMNIAVVGLGLIGGSFCKTLKKHTFHRIMGIDRDPETIQKALECGAIDEEIPPERLSEANLVIICLYPEAIVEFVEQNAGFFKKGGIVTDSCGVKEYVVSKCTSVLDKEGVIFVGTHPMAGREFSGFDYATDDLFEGASYIITPSEATPQIAVDLLQTLAGSLGFGKAVVSTPKRHDEIIAYTSQLAHVVSNAYVKSPTMLNFDGFSAGSFQDLTRVAKLNEYMWSELFMCNREALLKEIDCILERITEYRDAIRENDLDRLIEILRDGRELKEESLRLYNKH